MIRRFVDLSRPLPPPRPFARYFVAAILGGGIILALIVGARASCSVTHMRALALEHSRDMARRDHLDHDGFNSRVRRGARAENVAYGYKTEAATMAQWWQSPPHAANMRLPGCRAVTSAVSRSGRRYWTMEIGQ